MKRIRNGLIFIFVLLIGMTINVSAESFDYYLTNSNNYEPVNKSDVKNIKRGDVIFVTAVVKNSSGVTGYKLNSGKLTIRWDDSVSLQEVNGKYYNDTISNISGLTLGSVNKTTNRLTIGEISSTGELNSGNNIIAEFKFVVLNEASSKEFKIYRMDGEDSLKCLTDQEEVVSCGDSLYSELKYSIAKSIDNKLSSIKIDGQELNNFNENTNEYTINVEPNITKINIEVTKKDDKSSISGDVGEREVKYGNNKYVITVTSESGIANKYTLNVNKADNRSNINTLKALVLSQGEITFNPNVLDYTVNVENSVDKLTIKSSLTDSKSKYVVDYSNKEIILVEGSNKVEIKIISEKGEEKTYTLNINRALSGNNSLKSLKVNDEKITLGENEFVFNVTVENEVDEAIIVATPSDSRATINLSEKYPLEVGENEIIIKVVAASGEEASYTLNITRKKLLSKDSLLTNLKINGYDINFKPDVKLYNLKINDEEKLEITTTPEDSNATVLIEGNKNLENGSIIKINVQAEDGSYTRYFINIEKDTSSFSPIIIVIIILILLLGGCIGLIIYRRKKKTKDEIKQDGEKVLVHNSNQKNVSNTIEEQDKQEVANEESNTSNDETIDNSAVNVEKPIEDNSNDVQEETLEDENYVGAHAVDYVGEHEEEELESTENDNQKDAN